MFILFDPKLISVFSMKKKSPFAGKYKGGLLEND